MNKHLPNSLRALFLSLAVLLSLPVLAVEVEIDGINYDLISKAKQATVIAKSGGQYSGEVVIPESVEHEGSAYSVTSIGSSAFRDCSGLTSVNIPNSVTSIGDYAFSGCSRLTSVTIPNSVTSIGDYAFSGCSRLTSVTIPNSVTSIGEDAFAGCSGLTSVTIPNSVTSIGDNAFAVCSGLTSVTIPNSVTSIGDDAFRACSGLTSVTIPNSVTSIGNYAFAYCSGLTSVTIPNSVTSIGDNAFAVCSGLTSVTIPNSVTSIGFSAFKDCSGLTSVHISDIAAWCKIDFEDFASNPLDYAHHLYLNGEEVKDLVIPNSVTSIGDYAFEYCSALTSVTIPNSVTSIGLWAFRGCSSLTSVTIPNSVTSIGEWAFRGCSGLTSVTIPNSVTSIGEWAFGGCSGLTSVTIGNSVRRIGTEAFANCTELLDVYCYAEKVPYAGSDAFDGSYPEYATLHVPAASIDSYKAAAPWSSFGKIVGLSGEEPEQPKEVEIGGINYELNADAKLATVIKKSSGKYSGEVVIPESVEYEGAAYSVTSIGDGAFYECSSLTSVTIPNSVTSIGYQAFRDCSGLTSVTIPNSVTSIGDAAFYECSGLTSVPIGNSVTSIGFYAFCRCSGLTSVTIPNSVTSIGNYAFYECSGLTSVTIGNSVTSIGSGAFGGCSGLTSVIIGNSVTSIGSSAFGGCSGLTSVTIGNSVTSIGDAAFAYCSGLTSVTIGSGVESTGKYAFSYCPELLDVYCYAEKVPSTYSNAFDSSYPKNATLHVPDASIDSYKATAPWSSFGRIVGLSGEEPEQPEVEKCATPVVTYAEGKLSFSCDTEGANYVTKLVAEDAKEYYDAEIELSATYNIEVFATKANCENSDTVNVALVWVENGDFNEVTGVISVPAAPVLVQGNGGVLSVSGVAKGTDVVVYTISGTEVARSTATNGTATISTGLQSGTIVVVMFGNKSVKVRI